MSGCVCDFPDQCSGSGMRYCRGCGGDLCICLCGGELECFYGCDACSEPDVLDVEAEWGDLAAKERE